MNQPGKLMTKKPPVSITWDDLGSRKVEQRLREQQAMSRNRAYATLDSTQVAADAPTRVSLLNNTMFCMTVLGLLGGVLAWGCGFLTHLRSSEQQAIDLMQGIHRLEYQRDEHQLTADDAEKTIAIVSRQAQSNAYFRAINDASLTPAEQSARWAALQKRAGAKRFSLNVVSFGLSGMLLALCLGIAEPLTERNQPAMVKNGALSAMLGLIGGLAVAFFVERIYKSVASDSPHQSSTFTLQDVVARTLAWGVMGLFLSAGPGLLLRNPRKLLIGISGGLIGGAVGGALFDPIGSIAGVEISRLIAFIAIGGLAGLSTALIENVAKTGWLRVTHGLIAGKLFILYRNPTYIGSAPDTQIYLFRDAQVGRRHTALHLVSGGIDLEDLPLGTPTLVNGKPVSRVRLRHGDEITIGATRFVFQEKARRREDAGRSK